MDDIAKRAVYREAQERGAAFQISDWPRKLTYYKPSGEPMPNLPADAFSMSNYLARGFTLKPPPGVVWDPGAPRIDPAEAFVPKSAEVAVTQLNKETPSYTCDVCGKSFGARVALAGHKRSHTKEA